MQIELPSRTGLGLMMASMRGQGAIRTFDHRPGTVHRRCGRNWSGGENNATLFMVVALGACRSDGPTERDNSDIAVGTPVAGRGDERSSTISIGMFVNTLVAAHRGRSRPMTFTDLLAAASDSALGRRSLTRTCPSSGWWKRLGSRPVAGTDIRSSRLCIVLAESRRKRASGTAGTGDQGRCCGIRHDHWPSSTCELAVDRVDRLKTGCPARALGRIHVC